jgi:hypothetical protein
MRVARNPKRVAYAHEFYLKVIFACRAGKLYALTSFHLQAQQGVLPRHER